MRSRAPWPDRPVPAPSDVKVTRVDPLALAAAHAAAEGRDARVELTPDGQAKVVNGRRRRPSPFSG